MDESKIASKLTAEMIALRREWDKSVRDSDYPIVAVGGWPSLFGQWAEEDANYDNQVKSKLYHILMNERHISEKAFTALDELTEELDGMWTEHNDEVMGIVKRFEDGGFRPEFCAETLYSRMADDAGDNMKRRMQAMADKVAAEHDEALENIDQALDGMIAMIQAIEENIPEVETDNVPQQAALDNLQETLDEALKPYLADAIQAMSVFEA
jgi:hypothetical protein